MNPFQRIRSLFRKPAMIGTPPSARGIWHDPAAHSRDFAERYSVPLSYSAEQRMAELGIHPNRIGMPDKLHGVQWSAFHPHGTLGGSYSPDGRFIIDSGVLNPARSYRMRQPQYVKTYRDSGPVANPDNGIMIRAAANSL